MFLFLNNEHIYNIKVPIYPMYYLKLQNKVKFCIDYYFIKHNRGTFPEELKIVKKTSNI